MFTPNDEFTEKDMEDVDYETYENEQHPSEEEEEEADPSFANVDKIEDAKDDSWGSDNDELMNYESEEKRG